MHPRGKNEQFITTHSINKLRKYPFNSPGKIPRDTFQRVFLLSGLLIMEINNHTVLELLCVCTLHRVNMHFSQRTQAQLNKQRVTPQAKLASHAPPDPHFFRHIRYILSLRLQQQRWSLYNILRRPQARLVF